MVHPTTTAPKPVLGQAPSLHDVPAASVVGERQDPSSRPMTKRARADDDVAEGGLARRSSKIKPAEQSHADIEDKDEEETGSSVLDVGSGGAPLPVSGRGRGEQVAWACVFKDHTML